MKLLACQVKVKCTERTKFIESDHNVGITPAPLFELSTKKNYIVPTIIENYIVPTIIDGLPPRRIDHSSVINDLESTIYYLDY